MKKKILIVSTILLSFVTTGCGNKPNVSNPNEVVAKVDGYEIKADNLYNRLKDKAGISALIDMLDENLVNKEIKDTDQITNEAKDKFNKTKAQYTSNGNSSSFNTALLQAGFKNEQEYLHYLTLDIKKTKMANQFVKDNLNDKEINDYYNKEIYGEITIKHILIKPESSTDASTEDKNKAESNALAKANEALTKLNEGKSWSEIVKEYSNDNSSKDKDGLLAAFTKLEGSSYGDDFFNKANALAKDTYSKEVIKSTIGYHIVYKVDSKEKPALDTVKETIKETLTTNKFDQDSSLIAKTWSDIRKKYNIEINDSSLKNSYNTIVDNLKNN